VSFLKIQVLPRPGKSESLGGLFEVLDGIENNFFSHRTNEHKTKKPHQPSEIPVIANKRV